jgi:chromosome segregation ATPase
MVNNEEFLHSRKFSLEETLSQITAQCLSLDGRLQELDVEIAHCGNPENNTPGFSTWLSGEHKEISEELERKKALRETLLGSLEQTKKSISELARFDKSITMEHEKLVKQINRLSAAVERNCDKPGMF